MNIRREEKKRSNVSLVEYELLLCTRPFDLPAVFLMIPRTGTPARAYIPLKCRSCERKVFLSRAYLLLFDLVLPILCYYHTVWRIPSFLIFLCIPRLNYHANLFLYFLESSSVRREASCRERLSVTKKTKA